MIATFKETWKSLQNLKFGEEIVKKTAGQALWYWTKYFLLIVVGVLVLGIGVLTYFTPQLASLANKNLPDIQVAVEDGRVQTNFPQPFIQGDENGVLIINTQGSVEDLDSFPAGVLVLEDRVVFKSETETRIFELSEVEDFQIDKMTVVTWLNANQGTILIAGIVVLIISGLFFGGILWTWRLVSFLFWAVILFLAAKLLKRGVTFVDGLKIATYASVLPLFIGLLNMFSTSSVLTWLSLVVFLFYSLGWIYNLPSKK